MGRELIEQRSAVMTSPSRVWGEPRDRMIAAEYTPGSRGMYHWWDSLLNEAHPTTVPHLAPATKHKHNWDSTIAWYQGTMETEAAWRRRIINEHDARENERL